MVAVGVLLFGRCWWPGVVLLFVNCCKLWVGCCVLRDVCWLLSDV